MTPTDEQIRFFYDNAEYSNYTVTETEEQGRLRTARELAEAELWAASQGVMYQWEEDETLASPVIGGKIISRIQYHECVCFARHPSGKGEALSGIDLGYLNSPYNSSYARVIQAELASELKAQIEG